MTEIIFARPRHEYDSYTDLWRLVKAAGYPLIYIDEIDPQSDNAYLYSTPDASHTWDNPKAKIIYWLIEWYGDYQQRPGVAETWCCNRDFAERLGARFVPMGSEAGLVDGKYNELEKQYDVIHLSYMVPRRQSILHALSCADIRIAPNGWGQARHVALLQSCAMLHIHQWVEFPAIPPLRAAIAAAYRLPLIAENGWSVSPFENTAAIYGYGDLANGVLALAGQRDKLAQMGYTLYEQLCLEYTFKRSVESHV